MILSEDGWSLGLISRLWKVTFWASMTGRQLQESVLDDLGGRLNSRLSYKFHFKKLIIYSTHSFSFFLVFYRIPPSHTCGMLKRKKNKADFSNVPTNCERSEKHKKTKIKKMYFLKIKVQQHQFRSCETSSIKPSVSPEETACYLINCLQRSCIVGNIGARFWKGDISNSVRQCFWCTILDQFFKTWFLHFPQRHDITGGGVWDHI